VTVGLAAAVAAVEDDLKALRTLLTEVPARYCSGGHVELPAGAAVRRAG